MKLVITHINGAQAGQRLEITDTTFYVGRDPSQCRLSFSESDRGVSRRHAEISVRNGLLVLTDLQSTYGTFVNNVQMTQPVQLGVGVMIQFGQGGPTIRIDGIDWEAQQQAAPPMPQPVNQPITGENIAQPPPQNYNPSLRDVAGQSGPPPAAATGGQVFLELTNGPRPERYSLTNGTIGIGREPGNQIQLDPAYFPTVSRRHAQIVHENGGFQVVDLGSFNGTLVNGQRIAAPTALKHGNLIQIGLGGPELRYVNPADVSAALPGNDSGGTMVMKAGSSSSMGGESRNFLIRRNFGTGKQGNVLTVGRTEDNDIQLDVLQISKHHAKFVLQGGTTAIEDIGSTNGVYVNGQRVSRCQVSPQDVVQIGPYMFALDGQGVTVFDTRSKARIDILDITKEVKNRDGSGMIKLLDRVRLSIPANEFVGLLGPSGAGKSTLMDALNGMRPADKGFVLVNGLNLYDNINSFKQSIGYVPQDDIIHRELTVYRTLYYVARMRLSSDTTSDEIDHIISEVMDVTGLTTRRNVPIGQLSGGQRKRVSIAVELITKPGIIYLDEPTSGLDPGTEEKIMQLFRQISESGHSVILTTHAMENVKLFDKIVVMMRGRLVWFGPPQEALEYFGIRSIKDLFDTLGDPNSDPVAIGWQQKYEHSPAYRKYVAQPLGDLKQQTGQPIRKASNDNSIFQSIRQTFTLSRRYAQVLLADKLNLGILLGQAPVIAFLTALAVGADWTRDFPYFILALSSIWFGCSNAAREVVKESSVYKRERMVNLGILPYLASKLFILMAIGVIQCGLMYGVTAPLESFPGNPLLILSGLILSNMVGITTGLLVSSAVKTSEMATSLVPLILIPQILFGGLLLPNKGISKGIGMVMPAMWSYDLLKRVGLEENGMKQLRGHESEDDPSGEIGRIKRDNTKKVDDFKEELTEYRKRQQRKIEDYKEDAENSIRNGQSKPDLPQLDPEPEAPKIEYPPEDKSKFVGFVNDFGTIPLNLGVLGGFFFLLLLTTAIILRSKDVL